MGSGKYSPLKKLFSSSNALGKALLVGDLKSFSGGK